MELKHSKTNKATWKRIFSLVLTFVLVAGLIGIQPSSAYAASTITSMDYYSAGDGPVLTGSGVESASYGFVMPIFNGGAATWNDVVDDLKVNVMYNGAWTDIDTVSGFIYNYNWGHWTDAGFNGYWFEISETTQLQLQSKANPGVTLEYTLQFTKLSATTITSMTATQGPVLNAGVTGGCGFTYPTFNGDASITYEQVADDLKAYVKTASDSAWIDIDNNAASGWIYDQNFGQFWDGPGGYWFNVTETTYVRLQSKANPGVYLDYTINYEEPVRNSYTLSADTTTYTAGTSGEIGIPLPYIDGGYPVASEIDNFVYEILVNGTWVELGNAAASGFSYQGNGYNRMSAWNQWGYWVDGIYGLWFQPIQENVQIRIGYPLNGEKGGAIGNNYVEYTFIGNPDAPRPDPSLFVDIELGNVNDTALDGWELIWNDEFNGNSLDMSKWSYQTGYYLSSDPGTWGWGNAELEYYTDSTKNTFLQDGKVNFKALYEPTTFPEIDANRVAPYSSGKLITQNKFSFKYGRIDFCAKLPTGNGIWPALWMMPNDSVYGGWAASGEIDVMEARGRIPNSTSGTIHFGGSWPSNTYLGADYIFPEGSTFDDGYHVYSCIWEEDMIKWYVDGTCFSVISSDQWYSSGDPNNPLAPFDQEFYIIMNLAVGGWFDGGITPNEGDIPAEMHVEYVRVYQAEGDNTGSYTDRTSGIVNPGDTPETEAPETEAPETEAPETEAPETEAPGTGTIYNKVGDGVTGLERTDGTVVFYVNGATFADVHYKVNGGGQQNVGMTSIGNGQYRYTVTGLKTGDTIEYFFTYNPGNGALDSAWATFTLPASSDTGANNPSQPETEAPETEAPETEAPETNTPSGENIALGKTVTVSSLENGGFNAEALVDGNTGTRWASSFTDNEWFIIDLGKTYTLDTMVLNWEGAFGKIYEIQVSEDGSNYVTVVSKNNGTGGVETLSLGGVSGRYVKLQGITRGTGYGYSLYEAELYGSAAGTTTSPSNPSNPSNPSDPSEQINLALNKDVTYSGVESAGFTGAALVDGNTETRWASNFADDAWVQIDLGDYCFIDEIVLNWEGAYGKAYEIMVSLDGTNYTTVVSQSNGAGGIETFSLDGTYAKYVKIQGIERALPYGYSLYEVEVLGTYEVPASTTDIINVAQGANVTYSGVESDGFTGAALVDGDTNTRWASNFADDAWCVIDIGFESFVTDITLNWEGAYGKRYEIQVSTDGVNYTTVVVQNNGAGGIETYDINTRARYVKLQGIERALPYGYSLYEIEINGSH